MVLFAPQSSSRSGQARLEEPAPEAAPGDKRRCSAGEQQPHNERFGHSECFGFTAARIGGDPAAHNEQHVLVDVARSKT